MDLSRRDMLKLTAGSAALWAAGTRLLRADEKPAKKKIPIALQLYSVRGLCEKDLPGTLEAVGKMGYQGVEFAGYYGRTAEELRKLLDQNNLKCCGTHIGLDAITGDNLKKTVEFNKTLGNKFLIVASMPVPTTKKQAIELAKRFTSAARKVKAEGMRVGYHAHGGDFKKIEGQTFWDIFFSNAGPEVVMQLDTDNCLGGGGDPYAILKKFPGRAVTIHIKEHGGKTGAPVGEGIVKWDEIFKLCETPGKTEWYIVEHESPTESPLDSVKQCLENLRKMGK
jgi:sugar phosphate isomerase/epimerase